MFRSFLIKAFRNLKRNRLYTAINLIELAVGVACCLVIFAIVRFETSFDNYNSQAGRVYVGLVVSTLSKNGCTWYLKHNQQCSSVF